MKQEREQISALVTQCFDTLKTFGRDPEQLSNAVKLFCLVLDGYSMEQINSAFVAYLQNHAEMPTPSDIVGYIKRGNRKPMDRALYVALCQKRERTAWRDGPESWQQGDGLSDEETAYVREFEELGILA